MHKCLEKLKTGVRIFSHKELEDKRCARGINYFRIMIAGDTSLLILRKIAPKIDLL